MRVKFACAMLAGKQLPAVAGDLVEFQKLWTAWALSLKLHWVTKLNSFINKNWNFANVGCLEQTLLHGLLFLLT